MASITFIPANLNSKSGKPVIETSDFEGGFNHTIKGNVVSFQGAWYNPAGMINSTQTLIDVDPVSGNCAVVVASYHQGQNQYTNISGTLTISNPKTDFSHTGIAKAVSNNAKTIGDRYINAPFLLGYLNMTGF